MEPIVNPIYEITVSRKQIAEAVFKLGDGPKDWFPQIPQFVRIVRPFFEGLDHERVMAAYFNPGGQLMGLQVLAEGGLTRVEIEPVTLLRGAIMADARLVVLVHNHPNGTLEPSKEDTALVGQQIELLARFRIILVDSLVINDMGWTSIRQGDGKRRHEAIVKGEYIPDPADYNLGDPAERVRCAAELHLSAGAQSDPNKAEAIHLVALAIEGKMDPMEVMMRVERLRARSQMGFDPNGDDGPELLN